MGAKMTQRRRKVYDLLCAGWQSVTEIAIKTGFCDPRGYIRDLRDMGVKVVDEWKEREGVRYKIYHINADEAARVEDYLCGNEAGTR